MTEETLFELALKTPTAERAALLDRACEAMPELRERIEKLLAAHGRVQHADAVSDLAATVDTAEPHTGGVAITQTASAHAETSGLELGRYTLEKRLGEGGMGSVWVAKQTEPVKRRVALKLVRAGMDSHGVVRRFDAERQALAVMDHPNIAKVFDGGVFPDGRPFFAMELVNGLPITSYCDQAKLDTRERLEIFVKVCNAVQHAHQKGIIHRDLKPANVLVTLIDGRPEPKVIDFGVAKAVGGKLHDLALTTQFGSLVGTLEYMAPEQAGFSGTDVDTRADVYALGVVLYELLTGLRPFDSQRLRNAAFDEVVRIIRDEEPSKPSTRLSSSESLPSTAASRQTEPNRLLGSIRGDLDWIAMKCLEKDRNRRYETVNGLANDVRRHLADEPVSATPPSVRYRMFKWAKRHKTGLAFALTLWLVTAAAGGFAAIQYSRAVDARRIAEVERGKSEAAEEQTLEDFRATADDVMEQLIGSKPSLGPHEKQFLQNILVRWRNFADRQGDDDRSRAIRAEGSHRVAYLQQRLGDFEAARRAYVAAAMDWEELHARNPDSIETAEALARTCNNLGGMLDRMGRPEEGMKRLEQGLALRERLAESLPDEPLAQRDLAASLHNVAVRLDESGRHEEAERLFLKAIAIRNALDARFPTNIDSRQELARNHKSLGIVYENQSRFDDAIRQYERALAIRKELLTKDPNEPEHFHETAGAHATLGNLLNNLGRRAEARPHLHEAVELHRRLSEAFPSVRDFQVGYAGSCCNFGKWLTESGDPPAGLPWYSKAIDALSATLANNAEDKDAREFLCNSHWGRALARQKVYDFAGAASDWKKAVELCRERQRPGFRASWAMALLRIGKFDEAAAEAESLTAVNGWNAGGLYNLACILAAASKPAVNAPAEEKRRRADRAMSILHRAVAAGWNNVDHTKQDADLDALRDRADFQSLVLNMSASSKNQATKSPTVDKP